MPYNYIVYKSPHGNLRKIFVFGDQPCYESTGNSSYSKGTWFPFIMLKGSKKLQLENLPYGYNIFTFANSMSLIENPHYVIKYEDTFLHKSEETLAKTIHEGRIPTKSTLIISARLGVSFGNGFDDTTLSQAGLNSEEIAQAHKPITLARKPLFTSSDPDKINQWLINQGAKVAENLLTKKKVHHNLGCNNNFEISTETHKRIISEMKRYIGSRGKMENNHPALSWLSKLCRNHDLTIEKMQTASHFLIKANSTRNARELIKLASEYMYRDQELEEKYKIKHSIFTKSKLKTSLGKIDKILNKESNAYYIKNKPLSNFNGTYAFNGIWHGISSTTAVPLEQHEPSIVTI